ncbi:phosphodiester glycosidase family protein [Paenibacillus spiritus]|uniref:Phosphodiester glycosidase family protein n=1 Tax=Paenibacillus spiritus TaxID=2496557 RepID=A0A5J5FZP1_9BACL|nr:phosphodiester glycosidase family protein [Paenibacillus spiritus]KAA8999645.1 phosphodiester glycosidase family protein [Paenibacillus spiritus]
MMTPVKRVNRFLLLATAPFFGLLLCLMLVQPALELDLKTELYSPADGPLAEAARLKGELQTAGHTAAETARTIGDSVKLYNRTTAVMNGIVVQAKAQAGRPASIYNRRIQTRLGWPLKIVDSQRINLELYRINPGSYNGYALKVKLKDPSAMAMSLGTGSPGSSETTLQAVLRSGAVAGINAGGFADRSGKRYPLGTTMIGGQYVDGFQPSSKNLTFVGLNKKGRLIGGAFSSRSQLDRLQPSFGATFVPVLLRGGVPLPIPEKWRTSPTRAPRTVIGNYKDDQLLVLVVNGYNESGNSGATLAELQNKLQALGVVDAYNLDGGGSSSLILNGTVLNRPSDGRLRQVPTHFLFFK